jgi:hypothetical protein
MLYGPDIIGFKILDVIPTFRLKFRVQDFPYTWRMKLLARKLYTLSLSLEPMVSNDEVIRRSIGTMQIHLPSLGSLRNICTDSVLQILANTNVC